MELYRTTPTDAIFRFCMHMEYKFLYVQFASAAYAHVIGASLYYETLTSQAHW